MMRYPVDVQRFPVFLVLCLIACLVAAASYAEPDNAAPTAGWTARQWLAYAEDAARDIDGPEDRLTQLNLIAQGYALLGDPEAKRAVDRLHDEMVPLLGEIEDEETRDYTAATLVYALALAGEAEKAEGLIQGIASPATQLQARMDTALAAYELGDFGVLRAILDEADRDIPRLEDAWEREAADAAVGPYLLALGDLDGAERRFARVTDPSIALGERLWGIYLLTENGHTDEAKAWARGMLDTLATLDPEERQWSALTVLEGAADAGLAAEAEGLLPLVETPGERIYAMLEVARSHHHAGEDGLAAGTFERAVAATAAFKPDEEEFYTAADLWGNIGSTANEIGRLDAVISRLDTLDPASRAAFASQVAQNKLYLNWRAERLADPMPLNGGAAGGG